MKELSFDSGLVSYSLNGKCEVSFNPADGAFTEKFFNAFDALGKLQEDYSKRKLPQAEVFAAARERDGKMQELIDGLFGAPVCEAVFGDMSVCAFADGFPVWMNLMLAVLDEIVENLGNEEKRMDPRIAKYTAKYQKYAAKYRK